MGYFYLQYVVVLLQYLYQRRIDVAGRVENKSLDLLTRVYKRRETVILDGRKEFVETRKQREILDGQISQANQKVSLGATNIVAEKPPADKVIVDTSSTKTSPPQMDLNALISHRGQLETRLNDITQYTKKYLESTQQDLDTRLKSSENIRKRLLLMETFLDLMRFVPPFVFGLFVIFDATTLSSTMCAVGKNFLRLINP